MATKTPTHLELFFARTVRVRKEHIAGATMDETGELMEIIKAGSIKKISFGPASDMIIADTAIENKSSNKEEIDRAKERIEEFAKARAAAEKKLTTKAA